MTRITEWVLGIVGAIGAFVGAFILFAGDNQYIGIGGTASWRVGDIESGWGYGLLIGGIVLLGMAAVFVLWVRRQPASHKQQTELTALVTHIVVFVLVNAFLWVQDIVLGGGLNYAYWVTIPWGIGLIAHVIAYTNANRHPATPATG
jgi:hypothetical protein